MREKLGGLFKLGLLAVSVVAAGVVSAVIVVQLALHGKAEVETPVVEGNEIVAALEKINKAGLNMKITSLAYDNEAPRNTIISQDPAGGTMIKQDRDVRVIISRGPREFDMPPLIGLTLRQAANLMAERGLTAGVSNRVHAEAEPGEIIAQYPSAGSHVTDLDQVELLVSAGPMPQTLMVPPVKGMQLDAAKREMQKAGLDAVNVIYAESADGAAGAVTAQSPAPGTPVEGKAEMVLTVARRAKDPSKPGTYTLYTMTLPANLPAGTVKIVQESGGASRDIYQRNHKGGDIVSVLVEIGGPTTVRLFMNDQPVEVKQFTP